MLCDACKKNEATYHTIKQFNGIKTETHLCADCRRKLVSAGKSDLPMRFFLIFRLCSARPPQKNAYAGRAGRQRRNF